MRVSLRRVLCIVLCMVILCGIVLTAQATDGDEIRAAKKIISVVCDDSGSMDGDRWTYANYATQALIAQLNEQDELYITFMSDPNRAVMVNLKDLSGEVKAMERRDCPGGTPYRAVDTAYKKLGSIQASDRNAQYWLIVTTDGSIGDIPTSGTMNGTLQSVLNTHKGAPMPNGSKLNVAYLAMDANLGCASDTANGLYTFIADTPGKISEALSDVSNLISSRLKASPLKQIDSKTVSFESTLPIYSFSILSHQSSATVTGASTVEGALNIDRNIPLKKNRLFGNVAVVNAPKVGGKNQVIPAGTYTVTFSEDVDVGDLLIQYEPAIGVKMAITSGGVDVTPSALRAGDTMTIEMIPVIPGTDTVIDPASLPKGIQWEIGYHVEGNEKDKVSGTKLTGTTIYPGSNLIRGTMRIPGFSEVIFEERFTISTINYGLTVRQPDDASYPRKEPHKSLTSENTIFFTVTNDGVPMTKAELENFNIRLQVDSIDVDNSMITKWYLRGTTKADIQFQLNDDGTISLIPSVRSIAAPLVLSGKYTVTVSINNAPNVTATAVFRLVPDVSELGIVFWWLLILAAIIYVIMVLQKKKFTGQTVEVTLYALLSNGRGEYNGSNLIKLTPGTGLLTLRPTWIPCQKKLSCGATLVAGGDGTVTVSGSSIEKSTFVAYGTSYYDPEEDLEIIVDSLSTIETDLGDGLKERTAEDVDLDPDSPLYLKSSAGIIYSIKLL